MVDEVVHVIVRPEDNKCEGCGDELGEEFFETYDMVTVCKKCWDLCVEDALNDRLS